MDAANKQYALRDRAELSAFVNQPFRNNSRIKFTCFDCSPKYFVFGANSGSLYLYDRLSTSFLAIFPSQLGTIGKVSISHNEKQIAVGNQTGSIGVLLELEPPHVKEILSTELASTTDGDGQPLEMAEPAFVTSFCWTEDDKELYCGDSRGVVSLIQFSLFMGRNILNISLHPVLLLDNRIVQIDRYKDLLLVSTLSKCVLCNTAREEFKQIGNRPRDGQYGASFVIAQPNSNVGSTTPSPPLMIVDEEDVRIFCSRPGSRLWEADLEGNVIRTHQFKQAAANRRHRELQCLQESKLDLVGSTENSTDGTMMVVPFQVLYSIRRQLLLVHDRCQLLIIDPLQSRIVLRTDEFTDITHVAVVDEWIYLLTGENRVFQMRVEIEGDEDPQSSSGADDRSSYNTSPLQPILESRKQKQGVYILDSMLNNNGKQLNGKESPLLLSTEATIKEALVSVVRGKYGRNIKQMFMGYEQHQQHNTQNSTPVRPKTLNLTKIYEPSRSNVFTNGNGHALLAEFGIEAEAEEDLECDDMIEELVRTRTGQTLGPMPNGDGMKLQGKKKFSTSLLDGYETSEDDATVRNLYLIFRSSIISNLNFADRYAKIFDDYDTESIVRLLRKLENLMEENEEMNARVKCVRIYFNYLKPELLWEIDTDSRQFIKNGFILCNTTEPNDRACLSGLMKCSECGYYLEATTTCHYQEIGTSLMQYYWSRKEYDECFAMVKQVPYLWRTITRYYIQDRREDKVVACVWNLADRELFERAAGELPFQVDHWRKLFELVAAYHQRYEMICLSCDKPCARPCEKNMLQRDNTVTTLLDGDRLVAEKEIESLFRQWNYLLGVALSHFRSPLELLNLVRHYADNIPRGAIAPSFYIRCLLLEAN
ncbi:BLOC-2 complex member HPS5 homolog [Anopheles marshallii]|uniref:BLOC-2 complex member HPS5 homolog n=1 Tax=Anopheles marshallii TaxID=1521116 RepID=UPI00237ABF5B|nr:BLOC-2 complex member HPS5 homolog [Anopheles marshallii]